MKQLFLFSFHDFWMIWRGHLLTIAVGLIIGLLVGLLIRFRSLGIFMSIVLACLGSYFCDLWFFANFHVTKNEIMNEIIACTTGAIILSVSINLIFGSNRGRDRTQWRA